MNYTFCVIIKTRSEIHTFLLFYSVLHLQLRRRRVKQDWSMTMRNTLQITASCRGSFQKEGQHGIFWMVWRRWQSHLNCISYFLHQTESFSLCPPSRIPTDRDSRRERACPRGTAFSAACQYYFLVIALPLLQTWELELPLQHSKTSSRLKSICCRRSGHPWMYWSTTWWTGLRRLHQKPWKPSLGRRCSTRWPPKTIQGISKCCS